MGKTQRSRPGCDRFSAVISAAMLPQFDNKLGPAKAKSPIISVSIFCPDSTVMTVDDLAHNAQPQTTVVAEPIAFRPIRIETFEHAFQLMFRHTGP